MCLKLTIKTPERRQWLISHFSLKLIIQFWKYFQSMVFCSVSSLQLLRKHNGGGGGVRGRGIKYLGWKVQKKKNKELKLFQPMLIVQNYFNQCWLVLWETNYDIFLSCN